jgi:uncharacterized protein YegL
MKTWIAVGFSTAIFILSGLFACISIDTQAFDDEYAMEINYIRVDTVIDNNYAVTDITEEFYNPFESPIDETFSVQIPEKAFISNFSLTMDGETHYAKVVSKDLAKEIYNESVAAGKDAGLVESYGKSVFSYSVSLSPNQTLKVGLRYEQFLEKTLGDYTYNLFLTSGNIDHHVKKLEVNVDIKSELMISSVKVPDYQSDAKTTFNTNYNAVVSYETDALPVSKDFILIYELAPVDINGKILTYNDGTTGYFSHVFSPQISELGGSPMDKQIIFVLDKSGSMSGTKIQQLKDAFDEIVHELRSDDTFNIIMFDSSISKYKSELMIASQENQDAAAEYINNIGAGGSTNINAALTTGLDMFEDTSEAVPIIVFLTDGLPTAGETNTQKIRDNIKEHNTEGVSIFSLGFGYDVDFEFLKALSLENHGEAVRIEEGTDAKDQLTNFYDTISTPLLKGLEFDYSNGTYEIYPTYVDQLFEGSEVVIVGKYNLSLTSLTGNVYTTSSEGERIFSQTFDIKSGTKHSFIPRLWAYNKINYLLDEITVKGEEETLVGEVVTLAMEFEFVTPYTSLLITVEEPEKEDPPPEGKEPDDDHTLTKVVPDNDGDGDGYPDSIDSIPDDSGNRKKYNPDGGGSGAMGPPSGEDSAEAKSISSNSMLLVIGIIIVVFIIGAIVAGYVVLKT